MAETFGRSERATRPIACPSRPARAGPSDTVDIVFRCVGDVEIEHMAHFRDIQATCRHIACNQICYLAVAELLQCFEPGVLVHVAMQGAA